MIKAEQKKWAYSIFDPYLKYLLKNNFSGFYISGEIPKADNNKSLIITPNHFSWWDGFFVYFAASRFFDKKCYIMMLEEQLSRFWYFKKLGAFSINGTNYVSLKNTIAYTRELIADPGNMVVIYPQGKIEPFGNESRSLRRGLMSLIDYKGGTTDVMNAAFKIEYGEDRKPCVIGRFREPVSGINIVNDFSAYEESFIQNIDGLKKISLAECPGENLLKRNKK
jgi:hypothetical protein